MDKFKCKVAVITGASSGIGADLSVKLANHGLIVIGLARRVEKIEELAQKIEAGSVGKIIGRKCDLEVEAEILEAFQWISKEFGRIHVFVNNAGIMLSNFLIDSTTSENFRRSFNINVIASLICLREAIKNMRQKAENGHIFIINRYNPLRITKQILLMLEFSSILGHRIPDVPYPAFGVYPSTKYSLTAVSQTLRQEISFYKLPIKLTVS